MSNLVKTSYLHIDKQTKRVIDTNELMEARLAKIRDTLPQANNSGFVPGIRAESIDVTDALFADNQDENSADYLIGSDGNVLPEIAGNAAESNELAKEIIDAANKKGDEIVQRSIVQAQDILNDANRDAENAAVKIRKDAENKGYEEGRKKAEIELAKAKKELEDKARQLELDYERQLEELEPAMVEKITDIYQYFFGVDLGNKRQILLHLISTTMRHLDGTKNFLIHVSREDSEYVGSHKEQIAQAASAPGSVVEIIEDISLKKNECMIETDGGIFDCSLDTELKELTRRLRLLSYTGN